MTNPCATQGSSLHEVGPKPSGGVWDKVILVPSDFFFCFLVFERGCARWQDLGADPQLLCQPDPQHRSGALLLGAGLSLGAAEGEDQPLHCCSSTRGARETKAARGHLKTTRQPVSAARGLRTCWCKRLVSGHANQHCSL